MVSHDLLRLTVTNQMAFDRRYWNMFNSERTMGHCCQVLVSKLETQGLLQDVLPNTT